MFQGSIPQSMRNILSQIVKSWDIDAVHVGCSGNFTVERVLAELGVSRIYGCDVTIYSCAIGAYLAQEPFSVSVKEEFTESLGWLSPYLETPAGALAVLQLCPELLQGINAAGEWKNNSYYNRITSAYRAQWDGLHTRTVEKIESLPFVMAGFYSGDAALYVNTVPEDEGFISYPPFWAGGYEAMWHKLDMVFDWDVPTYPIMGDEEITKYINDITNRKHWAFGIPVILDEYKQYLSGVSHTTNRGVPIYMYASSGPRHIVMPRQDIEPVFMPRLLPGDVLGGELKLVPLAAAQFAALRSQYMNAAIPPAAPAVSYAVVAGDKLVGAYALLGHSQSFASNLNTVYLLSDFPVAPTDYSRLAKLVLYAALSKEGQQLAERVSGRRIRKAFTTAFSKRPSSMKYRGLFKVDSRKKETDDEGETKYTINYVAPIGEWSLAEGYAMWQKKYGERA